MVTGDCGSVECTGDCNDCPMTDEEDDMNWLDKFSLAVISLFGIVMALQLLRWWAE